MHAPRSAHRAFSGIVAAEKFANVAATGVAHDAKIIPPRVITEEGYSGRSAT